MPKGARSPRYELVVVANRLPVDRVVEDDGTVTWQQSPGGLVTAMESVMPGRGGAWVGWSGDPGEAPEPFDEDGMHLHAVPLSEQDVEDHYEGFSNETLWPLYHDVIVPPRFRRRWCDATGGSTGGSPRPPPRSSRRAARSSGCTTTSCSWCRRCCASCGRTCRSAGSTTSPSRRWSCSPSCRGGAQIDRGPAGRRPARLPAPGRCRQLPARCAGSCSACPPGATRCGVDGAGRRTAHRPRHGVPHLDRRHVARGAGPEPGGPAARQGDPRRAGQPRARPARGRPPGLHQGHPAPAQGLRGDARATAASAPPTTVLVQVATPSRERVEQPTACCASEVEVTVGRINGDFGKIGTPGRPLPAPVLPPRGDGGAVPGGRRHAGHRRCATA